jgi:hypothetical protein
MGIKNTEFDVDFDSFENVRKILYKKDRNKK